MMNIDCWFNDHNWRRGHCLDCHEVNYALLGWYGARARWAKTWDISEAEVERRWGTAGRKGTGSSREASL